MSHSPMLDSNQLKKSFVPVKPVFEESTLRAVYAFVTGLCLRYLVDGNQLSLTRGFGEVMNQVTVYTDTTYGKVIKYMMGEAKLDASYSDHQITVAEACKEHFQPINEPLLPGVIQNDYPKNILRCRIRGVIEGLTKQLYQQNAQGDDWAFCIVEFDMGTMQGKQDYKYPGFRVMLSNSKRGFSHTHHYLIQEFNTPEQVTAYTVMMAGSNTRFVTTIDEDDVATDDRLRALFQSTVLEHFRIKSIQNRR